MILSSARAALGAALGAALAAIPEAALWTGLWAAAPSWLPRLGRSLAGLPAGPAWPVAISGLVLAGLTAALAARQAAVRERSGRPERPLGRARRDSDGIWVVAAAVTLSLAALILSGPPLAVACLGAAWRGMAAAEYGQSAHDLRRVTILVAVGFAILALIFGRAGLPLDTLLVGLFLAVVGWLVATVRLSGSTVDVGIRSYSLPYRSWQRRVATLTIIAAVGLPALLVLTWAVWRGPASLGLGAVGHGLRVILGWVWGLIAKVIVAVLTVLALAVEPLVVWLQRRITPPSPDDGQGGVWSAGKPSEWLKQIETGAPAWPWLKYVVGAIAIGLALWLLYRYARAATAHRLQSLSDRVEDLTPEAPGERRRGGRQARTAQAGGLSPVRAAYRSFLARLATMGLPRSASTTPIEFAKLVEERLTCQAGSQGGSSGASDAVAIDDVATLTGAYHSARYGRAADLPDQQAGAALRAWGDLKRRLVGRSR